MSYKCCFGHLFLLSIDIFVTHSIFIYRYARNNGYPVLENVSLPRVGAMKTTLDCLAASPSNGIKPTEKGRIHCYRINITIVIIPK